MPPFLKPESSRIARARSKRRERHQRVCANRAVKLAIWKQEKELRYRVIKRDDSKCRVCGRRVFSTDDPLRGAHVHHIVYRSAGGDGRMSNLICVCPPCHDLEHTHRISITGTATKLTVKRLHPS